MDRFSELFKKQLIDVQKSKKISRSDMWRIVKHTDVSIFNNEECCLWNGYITNIKHRSKGVYVNFYFRKRKVALHRLLYANYVGEINRSDYIRYSCPNKGRCCNITHMLKVNYIQKDDSEESEDSVESEDSFERIDDKFKLVIYVMY